MLILICHHDKIYLAVAVADLFRLFRNRDADRSGKISPDEFRRSLEGLGAKGLSARLLQEVVRSADRHGNGQLDCNAFVSKLRQGDTPAPSHEPDIKEVALVCIRLS